jgi:hypothetical protein
MKRVESKWYQLSLLQNTKTDSGHTQPHLPPVKTIRFVSRGEQQLGHEAGHSYARNDKIKNVGATPLHIPYTPYDGHKYTFTFSVFIISKLLKKMERVKQTPS